MSIGSSPSVAPTRVGIRVEPRAAGGVDARALEADLRRRVRGEVRFDDGSRALYAVDASNYRQVPIGVVVPRSVDDVVATVGTCRDHGAPLLSRGGGTSLAGQCCNVAVVIDWSKYLNRIVEVNPERRFARVEPGLICDGLVAAARPHRLTYGPDPATHDHCTFGGMLGNNSCGVHAQFAGKAVDNTEAMEVLLYDGTRLSLGWMDEATLDAACRRPGRVGEIHARLRALRDRYAARVRERYPHLLRRVSGYNLDQLLPDEHGRFNLARAVVGSESTCVTILEATVRLVYDHPERALLVVGYPDVFHAADHVPEIRRWDPIGLEAIDARLIHNIRVKGGPHAEYIRLLPGGGGYLLVEFGCDTQDEAAERARGLMAHLERDGAPPT
jgi:FAD/FMN-containing dehydrogenase